MNPQIPVVLAILGATILLFVSDRIRLDIAALLSLLALGLTGILTPAQALAGFSDPVVIMIAALFVVGDGLFQTGVAARLGRFPALISGDSEVKLLVVVMLMVALLSSVLSSTGTVAVMLPVVAGLARTRNIPPSRLLIPMAVASLLGGMLTLVGTPPNLVVSNLLTERGRAPFDFFDFTPVGGVMVGLGILFMALVGRRLLPDRTPPGGKEGGGGLSGSELARRYQLASLLVEVPPESPLAGRSPRELALPERFGATITAVGGGGRASEGRGEPWGRLPLGQPFRASGAHPRNGGALRNLDPDHPLEAGEHLHVQISPGETQRFLRETGLRLLPDEEGAVTSKEMGLAEVLLTPRSRLLGRTLREVEFRERYRVTVLAVRRLDEALEGDVRSAPIRFGDTLLVRGPWEALRLLKREHRDFVVLGESTEMEEALSPRDRAPLALAIVAGMMVLLTWNPVPAALTVLSAAVLMVLTRCVTIEDAYRSINWESVILIAGVLPMATALETSGALAAGVGILSGALVDASPLLLMGTLFLITSTLSQAISNTATTVLVAPLAWGLAEAAGVAPEPILMTVAVAASTAFATPMASPVNTLVLGPGGYRFSDFFRIGALLQVVILVATLLVVPLLFPL